MMLCLLFDKLNHTIFIFNYCVTKLLAVPELPEKKTKYSACQQYIPTVLRCKCNSNVIVLLGSKISVGQVP